MTEAEWLNPDGKIEEMLMHFCRRKQPWWQKLVERWSKPVLPPWPPKVRERKLRLFASACLRRVWHLLVEIDHDAIVLAEAGLETLTPPPAPWGCATAFIWSRPALSAAFHCSDAGKSRWRYVHPEAPMDEGIAQAALLRDIMGNPFRPVTVEPRWRTGAVRGVALAAYEDRILPTGELDPTVLAVLADALEEAGAGHEVLEHLRGKEPHYRGCWVVDGCLGRT